MMRYLRHIVITLFLIGMFYLIYDTYTEYMTRQTVIEEQKKKQQEISQASKPDLTLPIGIPSTIPGGGMPPPPPPPQKNEPKGGSGDVQIDVPQKTEAPTAKVKVAGVVEFEINEDNSWQTVYKILAIILGSVLGIKIINTGFNKIERQT